MTAAWLWALASTAWGVTRTVDSTADTDTGTGSPNYTGTLRYHLNRASPGDLIVFAGNFGSNPPTAITVSTALPTITDDGVIVDGDGRVAIVCATAMSSGDGLAVSADGVQLRGFEVRDCPGDGIQVAGHDVEVVGNHVHDNDQLGVLVTGLSTATSATLVEGNDVHHNCASPAGVSCAGIGVKKGTGTGVGPEAVFVTQNTASDQQSASHGIALFAGSGHLVLENEVDGNAGTGISVAATTAGVSVQAELVSTNDVTGNAGPGILLGTRSSSTTVSYNLVAGNGAGTVPAPGVHVYGSDDHVLEGNEVVANGADGIRVSDLVGGSPAERLTIRGNFVGTNAGGAASGLANGAHGLSLSGNGTAAVDHLVEGNTFANNGGTGVTIDAGAVSFVENVVGLGPSRNLARPNVASGVVVTVNGVGARLDGRVGGVDRPNYVASNGQYGVVIAATGVLLSDNVIGWSVGGDARGNGADGVWVKSGADVIVRRNRVGNSGDAGIRVFPSGGSVTDPVVSGNTLVGNGDAGLQIDGVSGVAEWTKNTATGNGTCALLVASGVNGAVRDAVPLLARRRGAYLEGTYTVPAPGVIGIDRVEVFADDGSEAGRFLGEAALSGGEWSLTLDDGEPPLGPNDRISAVAVFSNGASSRLEEWCGDGCPEPGAASCRDGDDCTTDTCSASVCGHAASTGNACEEAIGGCFLGFAGIGTCSSGVCNGVADFAAEGTACVDDDACTVDTECDDEHVCRRGKEAKCEDGNPCTSDDDACDPQEGCGAPTIRPEGYRCDDLDLCNTGMGTCNAVGGCADIDPNPTANPMQTACNDCDCDPESGWRCEGIPNDGWCVPDDFWIDSLGGPDPDCMVGVVFDTDNDGFPDVWEESPASIDVDCDGTPDELVPGTELNVDFFDPVVKNVLYEVDWMAGDEDHEHVPADLSRVEDMFSHPLVGMEARVDRSGEVPHVAFTEFAGRWPRSGTGDWQPFSEIKAEHFDVARRRGVYHYGVLAHAMTGNYGGTSENFGDDAVNTGSWVYADLDADPDNLGMGLCVHEFGHNSGLNHDGSVNEDDLIPGIPYHDAILDRLANLGPGSANGEVNLLSSMNYHYGGGMVGVGGVTVFDYARAYPVGGSEVLLNELHVSAGFSEADTLWSEGTRIDDDVLYKAEWECPDGTVKLDFPHSPGTGWLVGALRRMDLDCDGLRETTSITTPISYSKGEPVHDHTSFDEWRSLLLDFQRDESFAWFGPSDGTAEVSNGPVRFAVQTPAAQLLGGCASPTVPRGTTTTYRTPLVLFGSPTFRAAALPVGSLAGAPAVRTEVIDLNADGTDDLWLEFRPADMTSLNTNATEVHLYGERANGRVVAGTYAISRVTAPADTDGDGIHDACDACPVQGHPPGGYRLPNGCPP